MVEIGGIITKAIDGFYYILVDKEEYCCKSRKKFRFKEIEPKVGDRVTIKIIDRNKKEGVIENIHKRVSDFIRPQISNVTQIFIVLSYLEPKINFEMLNKMLINFEAEGVKINIVINKCDLHTDVDDKEVDELFKNFPYDVITISVKHENNIDIIKDKLCNNISCFCGASGVGKSSLLNKIVDKNIMDTSTLSQKVKRGKHTTRFSQLVYIDELDGYLIDTPGFSSVNISKHIDIDNLREYFIEFKDYYEGCKFRGCKHINEIKCNVKQALQNDNINRTRYEMYVKFYNKFNQKEK